MIAIVLSFILGAYFMYAWKFPKPRPVEAGHRKDILLPHTEELELYYNGFSSCSQKVRACLGETGLKFKGHHFDLPSSGSWSTKKADFLAISPAGTVPVLVHKGHPIYESHEQIKYISEHLLPEDNKLTPTDPDKMAIVDKWVKLGEMQTGELFGVGATIESGMRKRLGNMLPPLTMPLFCAIAQTYNWRVFAEDLFMLPLVTAAGRKFVAMHFLFRFFGVEGIRKISFLYSGLKMIRTCLKVHLDELTKDLKDSDGPYLCGDQYTLADISVLPVMQRLEVAGWWPFIEKDFPEVRRYYETIRQRPGFQSSLPDPATNAKDIQKINHVQGIIETWRNEHQWFREIYAGK